MKNFEALEMIANRIGTPYFVMAVSHVLDVGYRHLTAENVEETKASINEQDDSNMFMSNSFSCFIVDTAFEIRQAALPLELAAFVSRYTDYNDNEDDEECEDEDWAEVNA